MAADAGTFDLVVLGGGPVGVAGAITGALLGHRVALVERDHDIGGAGINTGTMPSKTLRETALVLSGWRSRRLFGVDLSLQREATDGRLHAAREARRAGRARSAPRRGSTCASVERFRGAGSFVDPHTMRVASPGEPERHLRAAKILIATGSSPAAPAGVPVRRRPRPRLRRNPQHHGRCRRSSSSSAAASSAASTPAPSPRSASRCISSMAATSLMPFLDGEISRALDRRDGGATACSSTGRSGSRVRRLAARRRRRSRCRAGATSRATACSSARAARATPPI